MIWSAEKSSGSFRFWIKSMAYNSYRSNSPSRQLYPDNNDYRRPRSPQRFNNNPPSSKRSFNSRTSNQASNQYGNKATDYEDGRGYSETQPSSQRKCCVAAIAALAVALLIGLALGIYFGVTSTQNSAATSEKNTVNDITKLGYSGYYVDGVYVVPVTTKPSKSYVIIGTDQPCNPHNNNSLITPNPYDPNCNVVTTKIANAPPNLTTPKTPPPNIIYLNTCSRIEATFTWIGFIYLTSAHLFTLL